MIHTYTVLTQAYDAILSGCKDIEVRTVRQIRHHPGEYLRIQEYKGTRQLIVRVDEVLFYQDISSLSAKTSPARWTFEPRPVFEELVEREFGDGKPVMAIRFHLPLISAIMPAHNAAATLAQTLDCIRVQTCPEYALTVLDDASEDDTAAIVEGYMDSMPVVLLRNAQQQGAALSRNRGIGATAGRYLAFLDSDDLFEPELFDRWLQAMETTGADVAIAEFDSFFSADGYTKGKVPALADDFVQRAMEAPFAWTQVPAGLLHWTNVPWNKLLRRDFVEKENLRFQDLPCSNDVSFGHRAMALGRLIHVRDVNALIHYRVGRKDSISESHDPFCEIRAYEETLSCLEGCSEDILRKVYDDFLYGVMKCIRLGRGESGQAIREAVREDILHRHRWFPREFIERYHPEAPALLAENSPDLRVNFVLLDRLYNAQAQVQICLRECGDEPVGLLENGPNENYLKRQFAGLGLDWCCGREECLCRRPQTFLCLNVLQLTELRSFLEEAGLENSRVIPLYGL